MAFSLIKKLEEQQGLIDPQTAIEITGLSRSTIYRMIATQEIPNFKMRDRVVIDPHTWSYKLQREEPMLKLAARAR